MEFWSWNNWMIKMEFRNWNDWMIKVNQFFRRKKMEKNGKKWKKMYQAFDDSSPVRLHVLLILLRALFSELPLPILRGKAKQQFPRINVQENIILRQHLQNRLMQRRRQVQLRFMEVFHENFVGVTEGGDVFQQTTRIGVGIQLDFDERLEQFEWVLLILRYQAVAVETAHNDAQSLLHLFRITPLSPHEAFR